MLFEHVIGEVKLIVDGVFSRVAFEVFISHLLDDIGILLFGWGFGLCGLILESGGGVGKYGVALLYLSEYLFSVGLFGEIGVVFFDEFEVGGFELLFSEAGLQVEEFIVIDVVVFWRCAEGSGKGGSNQAIFD